MPGYLESRDPETGELQWRWNTTPRKGEPGSETWPNKDAMEHGGGMTWMPGTYDPELNLYYLGTGNPNPVFAGQGRKGDNLCTCSIVALNPDTGKMAWYFQASPHDTHDWDAVQTPVLFDGDHRRQAAQAARAGQPQRLLLRARPHQRQEHRLEALHADQLVEGRTTSEASRFPIRRKTRKPDGMLSMPRLGWAPTGRRRQFQPANRSVLRQRAPRNYSMLFMTDDGDKPEGLAGKENNLWSKASVKAHRLQDRQD